MKINPSLPTIIEPRLVETYNNIVEMTHVESFFLWKDIQDDSVFHIESSGCGLNVGFVNDNQSMPIFISLNIGTYKGVKFISWEATSRFVDYDVVRAYFDLHFKNAKHTDAINMHNIK